MSNLTPGNDSWLYSADRPLVNAADDRLGRASFASRIAVTLAMRTDPTSLVIGLYGEWGDGKSSVLNFVQQRLERDAADSVLVLRFNPWLYGDETTLIEAFFRSLGDLLDAKLTTGVEKIGEVVRKVGEAMRGGSVVSHGISGSGTLLQAAGASLSNVSLTELRERVEKALLEARKRVVVLIDDVDRLDRHEITTVMRVVKIAADFSYTAYILAFDKDVVSDALAERYPKGSAAGENFLEKIVQVPLSLPRADASVIRQMLGEEIVTILNVHDIHLPVEEETRLLSALDQAVLPRLRTVRVLRRLANAIEFALPIIPDEVNAVDVILVESLRTLFPKMYEVAKNSTDWIVSGIDGRLTATHASRLAPGYGDNEQEPGTKTACHTLMRRLFPQLDSVFGNVVHGSEEMKAWTERRRICSPQYTDRYFSYGIPPGDVADAEVLQLIANADGTDAGERLQALLVRGTPGLALQKMVDCRADVPADKAMALARLLTVAASSLNGIDTGGLGTFAVQTSFLVVNLVRQVPSSEWFAATTELIQAADPRFATLLLRMIVSYSQPGEPGLLSAEEVQTAGTEYARRLDALDHIEPLALRWPALSSEMYWVWSRYVEPGLVADRIVHLAEHDLAYAAALVRAFLPEVADHFSGVPSMSGWTLQQYQTAAELIPFDRLTAAIAMHLPDVAQRASALLDEPNHLDVADISSELQADAKALIRVVALYRETVKRSGVRPEPAVAAIDDMRLKNQSSPRSSYAFGDPTNVDLTLRVLVEIPGDFPQTPSPTTTATEPGQPDRDDLVVRLLEGAEITRWVRNSQDTWHIGEIGPWRLRGRNSGDESLAYLDPQASPHTPISARAYLQTGWIPIDGEPIGNEPTKGLRLVLDVDFRLLELDDNRSVGQVRHVTTPAPAPGALTLRELASLTVAALGATNVAIDALTELIKTGGASDSARVTCWLEATNASLDRVIKLVGFPIIPGNTYPAQHGEGWNLRLQSPGETNVWPAWGVDTRRKAATEFIAALLTSGGGREIESTLGQLWAPADPQEATAQ